MLRATHVNQTMTVWLLYLIKSMKFSIVMFFLPILAIIQDWDHKQWFLTKHFKISIPWKHRWFTHTLLFILLLIWIIDISVYFIIANSTNNPISVQWFIDFFKSIKFDNIVLLIILHWHLLGDILTKQWIPYFYPFYKKNIKIPLFSTRNKENKYDITWEMWLNFFHSVINILLISYIVSRWDTFWNIILEPIKHLKNSGNQWLLIAFLLAEIIFIIMLFYSDIKKSVDYMKNFYKNIFRVLFFMFIWLLISWIIFVVLTITNINLTEIFKQLTNIEINVNLNMILYISLILFNIFLALRLTKKYIVSLSSSIAYVINVFYILALMWLFLYV